MSEQEVFDTLKYRIEVDGLGNRLYYNNAGQLHRTGGPAIECPDNSRYWYQYGHLHRENGPAVEFANGKKNGIKMANAIVLTVQPLNGGMATVNGGLMVYIAGRTAVCTTL